MSPVQSPSMAKYLRGFEALRWPNFRRYYLSQGVSVSGNWMQTTALGWLVVQLTGDGVALGTTLALQYAPLLIFGPWGGVLVDRLNVRRLVIGSQAFAAVLAFALFLLARSGNAAMPAIYLISLLMGIQGVVDNPARRMLVSELVPNSALGSAVSLMGIMVNTSRVVGPAIAAGIIAVVGTTPCFLLNAISYLAVVLALLTIHRDQLIPQPARLPGPIRVLDTLRYVARDPGMRRILVAMTLFGTFALEMPVVLPLLASVTFHGDGSTYGVLLAVLSVGGVIGAVFTGATADGRLRWHEPSLVACGVAMTLCALAPTLPTEMGALFLTGICSFAYITTASTGVQINATVEHRGRVLALWSMAFLGTTMVGAPFVGWVANVWGPPAGLLVGAISCFVAAGLAFGDQTLTARRRAASGVPASVAEER